ncbi:MAG: alpha/beta hydrolase [Lachnospiraceae bacterium]|nr:alpha/beta hydrolase [Lachnospiraceae bacterium]
MAKLAVFFPGIGYTVDKPLMYYSRKLAVAYGYEIILLPYQGFPENVKGNPDKMVQSYELALAYSIDALATVNWNMYDEILFVAKSVGTIVAATLADQSVYKDRIRLVLYTPLIQTFQFDFNDAIVFTGSNDPWVGDEHQRILDLCYKRSIRCEVFDGANHSLETGQTDVDLEYMKRVMAQIEEFLHKTI